MVIKVNIKKWKIEDENGNPPEEYDLVRKQLRLPVELMMEIDFYPHPDRRLADVLYDKYKFYPVDFTWDEIENFSSKFTWDELRRF